MRRKLVRDPFTLLTYAQLGIFGYFLHGFGPVVPLLRDEQGTSRAVASRVSRVPPLPTPVLALAGDGDAVGYRKQHRGGPPVGHDCVVERDDRRVVGGLGGDQTPAA